MTVISYGTGRVQAAEGDCFMAGRLARQDGSERGVNYGHGGSTLARQMWETSVFAGVRQILTAVADAGYVVAGQDQGGASPWASATAQARLAAQDAWLKTAQPAPGASASKPRVFLGISMGAGLVVNYLGYDANQVGHAGHVADCAALVLIMPALNFDTIYQNDVGGFRAQLGTAWGVAYPTPLPAHADPQTNMTKIAAAAPPTRLYVASDDGVQNVAMATANLANLGGNGEVVNLGATGHSDATLLAVDTAELVAWLRSVASP